MHQEVFAVLRRINPLIKSFREIIVAKSDILGSSFGLQGGDARRKRPKYAMIKYVPRGHSGGLLTRNSVESGVHRYPPFAVLKAVSRDHFCWSCWRRLREWRIAEGKSEPQRNWPGIFH